MDSRPSVFEFPPFRVDAARRLLERDGQPVPLSGKAFEILLALLQRPGELVDKETLMREVWPDTAVEENNLTVNISGLRKALGETVASPRLIVTVPGRGYRFAGELRQPNLPAPADAPRRSRRPIAYAILTILLAIGLSAAGYVWLRSKPARALAVLPFTVLNADAGNEFLGLGLADALITRLGNLHEIAVRPLSSVSRLAGKDPFQAGQEAGADFVLEGSVQTAGARIRVSVRMLAVKDRTPLWAETYDEGAESSFALEDSISARVAGSLVSHLRSAEQGALARRGTRNGPAFANYLRGRYYATKYTEEGFRKALEYLQQAIDIDPAYALAYSGLADTYYDASNMLLPPADAMPRAKAAAQRAVALDPTLADAHVSIGLVASKYEWNWAEANREFERALTLDPNLASAHLWYGLFRAQLGETARAVTEVRRAQDLDPLSNDTNSYLATALYWARRYDDAYRQSQRVIAFDPSYVPQYVSLGWILEAQGKPQAAVDACRSAHQKDPGPWTTLALARAYALAGNRTAAEQSLADVGRQSAAFVSGYDLAVVYSALGRTDDAFAALNDAYERRAEWLGYLKIDPQLDSLRSDPRFAALLRKMGL